MDGESYTSARKLAELQKIRRVEVFDRLVDFVLDGTVGLEQAIQDYKETCATEGII